MSIDEQTFDVEIVNILGDKAHVTVNGKDYEVLIGSDIAQAPIQPAAARIPSTPVAAAPPKPVAASPKPVVPKSAPVTAGSGAVTAPISGKILSILVKVGDTVTAGQVVAILEAMKMENDLVSPIDGKVKEIRVAADSDVASGMKS